MAGKSHDYSMNINIKAQADGIGKTNSEITQLANEVKGIDGKSINLKINLGGNAGKDIQSFVKNIGSIEKSLNTLSGKGLQSIEQGMSSLTKAANDVVSAIGSVQKSLDGINGKGFQDVQQNAGSANKSLIDVQSAAGGVQTALDGIDGDGLQNVTQAASEAVDQLTELASQMGRVSTVGGLGDNWNNSYGGRYGGMRYTGQGKGISDLVSFIGNGKSSYELTIENAMNKTRNMGVAKAWNPEGDFTGMDAYWRLDKATDHSLMSLNALAAGVNATAATTGASAKDIANHAMDFANFGTMVMGLGYTEDVAQTAIMKLGRGLHGTFAALDQYGITKESLTLATDENGKQLWNGDENDLDGYLAAVSTYSEKMSNQLLSTPTGQMATLSKSASLGGYALGAMEAQAMTGVTSTYKSIDDWMRKTTKEKGWGADVVDNLGQKVLSKKTGEKMKVGTDPISGKPIYEDVEKSLYVDANGNVVNDLNEIIYKSTEAKSGIEQAMEAGYSQKKTGVGLSTLIIGADQVISTYKTLKDTILGAYAEWRDLKRIRQIGLRNIFKGDDYDLIDGRLVRKGMNSACEEVGKGCPNMDGSGKGGSGKGKNKKKRSRLGRWKDNIGSKLDDVKNTITGTNPHMGKSKKTKEQRKKRSLNKKYGNDYTSKTGDYNLNNVGAGFGLLDNKAQKNIDRINRKSEKKNQSGNTVHSLNPDRFETNQSKADSPKTLRTRSVKRNGLRINKFMPVEDTVPNGSRYYTTKKGSSSAKFKGHSSEPVNTDKFYEWKREGLAQPPVPQKNNQITTPSSKSKSGLIDVKPTKIEKVDSLRDKINNNLVKTEGKLNNYLSKNNKEREAYANQYGGYMKRTNKAIFDAKTLKSKAKSYIKNKKKFLNDEFEKTKYKSGEMGKSWGEKGRQAPYKAWGGIKSGAKSLGSAIDTRFNDSFLGTQYGALKRQGSTVKNTITGSGAWSKAKGFAGGVGSQIWGNAGALYGMTTGKDINKTRTGKAVQSVKQKGVVGAVKEKVAPKIGKTGQKIMSGGGKVLSGMSTGIGTMATGLGKIGGLVGGIGSAFMGLLGPIGAVIMGVTLFMGICDALGIDLSPLQEAFGGFMEALQPAIQGLNEWIAGFAQQLGPVLTQLGQALGPILQAIGGLISGGLGALAGILGPILEGIGAIFSGGSGAGMFDGLAEGLAGLGPVVDKISQLMQNGGQQLGQVVGSWLQGLLLGLANILGTFWAALATNISNSIMIIANGISSAIGVVSAAITGIINAIGTAITTQLSTLAATIVAGIALISTGILLSFSNFASIVATATAEAYNALLLFQGSAVSLMGSIATDMVNAFKNNFTGIASAVDAEMAGAYQKLCEWGDKMVAKAGQIGRDSAAAYKSNSGIGSPGYVWLMTAAEWFGALGAMTKGGAKMVTTAASIGRGIVSTFISSHPKDAFQETFGLDTDNTNLYPDPVQFSQPVPISPPTVKEPRLSKEVRQQSANATPQSPVFNYNHYGDVDNEERMQKTMKYFSDKIDFENKRANRTV